MKTHMFALSLLCIFCYIASGLIQLFWYTSRDGVKEVLLVSQNNTYNVTSMAIKHQQNNEVLTTAHALSWIGLDLEALAHYHLEAKICKMGVDQSLTGKAICV